MQVVREENVLQIAHFRDQHYKWYKLATRGYSRLVWFLTFCIFCVLSFLSQHHTTVVNDAANAWRIALTQLKPDLVVKSYPTFWTFLSGKLFPIIFGTEWTQEQSGVHLQGYRALEYQYMIGGIAITSMRMHKKECFRGQDCYENGDLNDPFITIKLADNQEEQVPYNEFYKGYTVYIPITDKAMALSMLKMYQESGILDENTQRIQLNWISFNPNNSKTISLCEFAVNISPAGVWTVDFTPYALPYHFYPDYSKDPVGFIKRICLELLTFFFAFKLIIPLVRQLRSQEKIGADHHNGANLPLDKTGVPYTGLPSLLWSVFFLIAGIWIFMVVNSFYLPKFGSDAINKLFIEVPGVDPDNLKGDYLRYLLKDIYLLQIQPFWQICSKLNTAFLIYSILNGIFIFLLTLRFFQYLSFHKRLSMITDTFAGISNELAHLLIVYVMVTFGFTLICVLTFGQMDGSFRSTLTGFFCLLSSCFGLFRVASTQSPDSVGLYKYAPHSVSRSPDADMIPEVVLIFFKLLVFMLLFKFIIAMIMESYKDNHKKHRMLSRSVFQDLYDLSSYLFRRYSNKFFGSPFVPIETVARACYDLEKLSSHPNGYLTLPELRPWLPEARECDLDWVLRYFGLGKNKAMRMEVKRRAREDQDILSRKEREDRIRKTHLDYHDVKKVFDRLDLDHSGFMEIADLDDALRALGKHKIAADVDAMRRLVRKYDDNEDGVLEFDEFINLLQDEVIELLDCDEAKLEEAVRRRGRCSNNMGNMSPPPSVFPVLHDGTKADV